ncbi:glycoside hydrolase superfamily [Xylariaceae sp. FL1651]|nr:glycoside hydrolase superfamily [Xylariaceae sp. FL1651]
MSRRYSFDSDPGEHAPLDNPIVDNSYSHQTHNRLSPPPQRHPEVNRPSHDLEPPQPYYQDEPSSPYRDHIPRRPSPPPAVSSFHPGAHPDSAFARLRQNRAQASNEQRDLGATAGITAGISSVSRPIPPPHRDIVEHTWGHEAQPNSITPGADNFSEAAAGGIPGLAMSVAERNARESGLEAMRAAQPYQQQPTYPQVYQRAQPQTTSPEDPQSYGHDRDYEASRGNYEPGGHGPYEHGHGSSPNLVPLPAVASAHSSQGTPTRSLNSFHSDPFRDPQMAYGQRMDPRLGQFNPNDIDDDGDDGLEYRRSARNSMLSLGNSSNRGGNGAPAATAAGVAGAATASGVLGSLVGRNRKSVANYDPVQNPGTGFQASGPGEYDLGARAEKSEWITKQSSSRKKWTWIIIVIGVLIIAGAVVGGVLGSMYAKKSNTSSGSGGSSSGGGQSAQQDSDQNGDLNINSDEIQALLNNPNLHKVFPGVDYTPINVQYPDCLKNPPSQNNVTRDVAVLSQLTNTIRLYGTDCNQTEMTIHALNQLKMQDEIKIWLGVWQDNNATTNARQLSQMWNILDQYGDKPFKGLIIGNEILFRKQMTAQSLGDLLDSVRSNLSDHSWDLPVATSDLGDNWDASLAQISDYIMGNVHPFFAGQDAKEAASWTYTFWHNKAGSFFKADNEKNVISEIGWPTQGGTDCGSDEVTSCPDGAVAGIDELNTLLSTWVCQALDNGTNYFWFEMFDEPWKISFDTTGMEWEDHWGILDVNRKLKDGVKIPDCGGKTV